MSTKAFIRGLVIIAAVLITGTPVSCFKCLSCRCGSSNRNYTQCMKNELMEKDNCSRWAQCQTCKENTTHCITCPPKLFGPLCTVGVTENIRRKRQSLPFFTSTHCQNGGYIPNGRVTVTRFLPEPLGSEEEDFKLPVGTHFHYTCNKGYVLQGAPELFCEDTGYSSEAEPPTCTEVKCQSPDLVSNGKMVVYFTPKKERRRNDRDGDLNYSVGTRLRYMCDRGYTLLGKKTLSCKVTGLWSADEPTCIKECGGSTRRPGTEMPEGRAQIGEFPWVVLISAKETGSVCPGVLLNHRTVLTVAHCLHNAQYSTVHFGIYHRNGKVQDQSVVNRTSSQIIIHPEFNMATFDNDIAIVKFSPDVSYSALVQPICLPSSDSTAVNLVPGHIGHVIGWWLNERQLMTPTMTVASAPIQAAETCEMAYQRRKISLNITPGMLCAGFKDRGTSFCQHSSGSLLVFYNPEKNHFTLEGLVSHGTPGRCDLPERYVMFTKVSHYLPWILQHLWM